MNANEDNTFKYRLAVLYYMICCQYVYLSSIDTWRFISDENGPRQTGEPEMEVANQRINRLVFS